MNIKILLTIAIMSGVVTAMIPNKNPERKILLYSEIQSESQFSLLNNQLKVATTSEDDDIPVKKLSLNDIFNLVKNKIKQAYENKHNPDNRKGYKPIEK